MDNCTTNCSTNCSTAAPGSSLSVPGPVLSVACSPLDSQSVKFCSSVLPSEWDLSALFSTLCSLVCTSPLAPSRKTKSSTSSAPTASAQTRTLPSSNWPVRRSTCAPPTQSWSATGVSSTGAWTRSSTYGSTVRTFFFFCLNILVLHEVFLSGLDLLPADSYAQRAAVRAALAQDPSWVSEYLSKMLPMLTYQDNEVVYLVPWSSLQSPPQEGGKPHPHTVKTNEVTATL